MSEKPTILVVDDEVSVTRVMARQLQMDGHSVRIAQNAEQALAILEVEPLPDLIIDWSDPVMHVVRATRLSVASSVFDAFKAAAEQPGQPPQTSLIMAAVSTHLARLPELVLARRPEEHTDFSSFYRRPAAPSRNRTDPQVPLYIRPNGGEDQALNRIVDWVNAIITDGHPGRREASRSEIVAAALAAEYLASSKR